MNTIQKTYTTKYQTKFFTERTGELTLGGEFLPVPIGTTLEFIRFATNCGNKRALFTCEVNGQTLFGFQDLEFLND